MTWKSSGSGPQGFFIASATWMSEWWRYCFGAVLTRCHIHHPHHYQDLKPTKSKYELEDEQAGEVSQDVTLLNLEGGGGDVLLFFIVTLVMVVMMVTLAKMLTLVMTLVMIVVLVDGGGIGDGVICQILLGSTRQWFCGKKINQAEMSSSFYTETKCQNTKKETNDLKVGNFYLE